MFGSKSTSASNVRQTFRGPNYQLSFNGVLLRYILSDSRVDRERTYGKTRARRTETRWNADRRNVSQRPRRPNEKKFARDACRNFVSGANRKRASLADDRTFAGQQRDFSMQGIRIVTLRFTARTFKNINALYFFFYPPPRTRPLLERRNGKTLDRGTKREKQRQKKKKIQKKMPNKNDFSRARYSRSQLAPHNNLLLRVPRSLTCHCYFCTAIVEGNVNSNTFILLVEILYYVARRTLP